MSARGGGGVEGRDLVACHRRLRRAHAHTTRHSHTNHNVPAGESPPDPEAAPRQPAPPLHSDAATQRTQMPASRSSTHSQHKHSHPRKMVHEATATPDANTHTGIYSSRHARMHTRTRTSTCTCACNKPDLCGLQRTTDGKQAPQRGGGIHLLLLAGPLTGRALHKP